MDVVALRADCARCAALCCVALAFERSPLFAFDKANGEPCPNLDDCGRCRIHSERSEQGFEGCVNFDCNGAGQRVTQELFGGRSWRQDPTLLASMSRAFVALRKVHELLVLLEEAGKLELPVERREALSALVVLLEPEQAWSPESLAVFNLDDACIRVRDFLRSLRRQLGTAGRFRPRPAA